jgi:L,D-peptidoglycan transpeptidase YkuD (ErfK/YbiS/YcfS/YnhG family)
MKRRHRRSKVRERITLAVHSRPGYPRRGLAICGLAAYPCALGSAGILVRKSEGDSGTPAGCWSLLRVLYRADRIIRPVTFLPVQAISRDDGWCDAPDDRNYNSCVKLPYPVSAEKMWREDEIYNLVVVLDHNTRPKKRGRGSAVFIHLARAGFTPTQGCIAFKEHDLRMLLEACGPGSAISILP